MRKKWLSIVGLTCATVLGVTMFGCAGEDTTKTAKAESYVSIDINPSIELTLDANDKVLTVYGSNEDGQVLLYGEQDGLIGKSIETAVNKITELAKELGYFEDNTVINTTVSSENENKEDKILNKIDARITAQGGKFGIDLKLDKEQAFSLVRRYQQFLEEHQLTEEDLSIENFKLALSASETGDVSLEVAVEMDVDDLLEIIHSAHKQIKEYATREYQKLKDEKLAEMEDKINKAVESEYLKHFLTKLDFQSAYYCASYSVYNSFAHGLNALADQIDYIEDVRYYEVSDEVVVNVMEIFGIEDRTLIENSQGKVTIESIEAYADKVIKNSTDEQTIAQLKASLTTLLDTAETQVSQIISEAVAVFEPRITELVNGAKDVIGNLDHNVAGFLGDIATDVNELGEQLETLAKDGLTSDALSKVAVAMQEKADEAYADMQNAVEKAGKDLQEKIDNAKGRFEEEKTQIQNLLTQKENEIRTHLGGLKDRYHKDAQPQHAN